MPHDPSSSSADGPRSRVIVVGGGIAGLEALLALHDLAGERADLTLVAPVREFVYRPMMVTEPFDLTPAQERGLEALTDKLGADFVHAAAKGVRPADHVLELDDGSELTYDYLVVCAGGRSHAAIERATTFPSPGPPIHIDDVLAEAKQKGAIAFVVPAGVTWALPIYELALMTRRRARDDGLNDLPITIITPEQRPLAIFGPIASDAVAKLLSARGIEMRLNTYAHENAEGELALTPGESTLGPAAIVALPTIAGPEVEGLPQVDGGFLPIDEHARVVGAEDVYAAGDGTNFPIKQGGLGTQQADAAAAHIAQRLGASPDAEPFRPVLRGKLITGQESLHMRTELTGGAGESEAGSAQLWWPADKVSGRYLAPWFSHSEFAEPAPPTDSLDVEVSIPQEWHEQPQMVDPYSA